MFIVDLQDMQDLGSQPGSNSYFYMGAGESYTWTWKSQVKRFFKALFWVSVAVCSLSSKISLWRVDKVTL